MLGLLDEAPALDFDLACAYALHALEKELINDSEQQQRPYETSQQPERQPRPRVVMKNAHDLEQYLAMNGEDF